jgi:hypothetical protein
MVDFLKQTSWLLNWIKGERERGREREREREREMINRIKKTEEDYS